MSQSVSTKPRAAPGRSIPAEDHALAQVEKWMAAIREVSCDPREDLARPNGTLAFNRTAKHQ